MFQLNIKRVEDSLDKLHFLYMGLHLFQSKPHNICINVYFIYKSTVFKVESMNKLEKSRAEKNKIHKHNSDK